MTWPRFWWGLAGGMAAGGITYATEPARPYWWVVASVVAVVVWTATVPDLPD
ncbi:hypothetical protein ACQPXT_13740 [Streptomyces sp. CA-100214]